MAYEKQQKQRLVISIYVKHLTMCIPNIYNSSFLSSFVTWICLLGRSTNVDPTRQGVDMITYVDKTKKKRKDNWVKYLVSYIHSTKSGSISTYRLFQGLRCPTPRYAPTPHTHTQIRVTFLSSTQRKGTGFPPRFRIYCSSFGLLESFMDQILD